ncbi:hypothetical protein BC828DRAFT_15435 [Blastocladiella britannica]|nr:hypothetical protein BC828DRAFT_15435 [Blastocladiella britannica]
MCTRYDVRKGLGKTKLRSKKDRRGVTGAGTVGGNRWSSGTRERERLETVVELLDLARRRPPPVPSAPVPALPCLRREVDESGGGEIAGGENSSRGLRGGGGSDLVRRLRDTPALVIMARVGDASTGGLAEAEMVSTTVFEERRDRRGCCRCCSSCCGVGLGLGLGRRPGGGAVTVMMSLSRRRGWDAGKRSCSTEAATMLGDDGDWAAAMDGSNRRGATGESGGEGMRVICDWDESIFLVKVVG